MAVNACRACHRDVRIRARGLCQTCWKRHRKAGTLEEFPAAHGNTATLKPEAPTYRQLDYWCRVGFLKPLNDGSGSGVWREWPKAEIRVAEMMARLVAAGFTPEMAHRIARAGRRRVEVAPGVKVAVSGAR